jgi:hypothetical protein
MILILFHEKKAAHQINDKQPFVEDFKLNISLLSGALSCRVFQLLFWEWHL